MMSSLACFVVAGLSLVAAQVATVPEEVASAQKVERASQASAEAAYGTLESFAGALQAKIGNATVVNAMAKDLVTKALGQLATNAKMAESDLNSTLRVMDRLGKKANKTKADEQEYETLREAVQAEEKKVKEMEAEARGPLANNVRMAESDLNSTVRVLDRLGKKANKTKADNQEYEALRAAVHTDEGVINRMDDDVYDAIRAAEEAATAKANTLRKAAKFAAGEWKKAARRTEKAQKQAHLPEKVYEGDFMKAERASEKQEIRAENMGDQAEHAAKELYKKVEAAVQSSLDTSSALAGSWQQSDEVLGTPPTVAGPPPPQPPPPPPPPQPSATTSTTTATVCLRNTGGTCKVLPCDGWRNGAKCNQDYRCECPEGMCAYDGKCEHSSCSLETGGSCNFLSCKAWRNSYCEAYQGFGKSRRCLCKKGQCGESGQCFETCQKFTGYNCPLGGCAGSLGHATCSTDYLCECSGDSCADTSGVCRNAGSKSCNSDCKVYTDKAKNEFNVATCDARVTWMLANPTDGKSCRTKVDCLKVVNAECKGQCSCEEYEYPMMLSNVYNTSQVSPSLESAVFLDSSSSRAAPVVQSEHLGQFMALGAVSAGVLSFSYACALRFKRFHSVADVSQPFLPAAEQ